jgi:hypothetical protein
VKWPNGIMGHSRLLQQNRHNSDMLAWSLDVRYWMNSGKHTLALSFSAFDPKRICKIDELGAAQPPAKTLCGDQ